MIRRLRLCGHGGPLLLLALACLGLPMAGPVHAGSSERAELRERFKHRYPALQQLKREDRVGEVHNGFAAALRSEYLDQRVDRGKDESPTVRALLEAENRDRRRLFELLARELNTTPERVAEREGRRRFDAAAPHEYLKPPGGGWIRKRDHAGQAQGVALPGLPPGEPGRPGHRRAAVSA